MSAVQGDAQEAADGGGRRWSFAAVEFDERTFELSVRGQLVELERKALEVLRQLLYRAGEVVTKDELLEAVWPGRVLSDNSLPKSVSRIREVIGDAEQTMIKTVHGYGYRLVAPVKVQRSAAAPALTRLDLKAGDHPPLRPLWSLVDKLGSGGQGEVWRVRHDKTGEVRVFKFALDVAGLAAIKREITLYRFLRETLEGRDEFTRVLDWNLEEAPYYIELEHSDAGNLEAWCNAMGGAGAVPLPDRLELVARIAEALAAAHSVGVLHKDLKPSNVLVSGAGEQLRVRLADFGSGGVLDLQRLEALGITRLGFTQSVLAGEAAATTMYLAPEVIMGQPATVQADVYALGVVLYQMAVGDLREPLAPGWEQRVGDPLLCEDIAQAVAGDPSRRVADASAFAARLRTLEDRRAQRAAERAEKIRLEREQQVANERARNAELAVERLRARRTWQRTVLAVLIVGVSLSLALYLDARRARNQAANAAASSQAVADFLSKDMFAVVGTKPLRELSVRELLESASASLTQRAELAPHAAAEIHTALGRAFWAMERPADAAKHLDQALAFFDAAGRAESEGAVSAAADSLVANSANRTLGSLTGYEARLELAQRELGAQNRGVLNLRLRIAEERYVTGDWLRMVADLRGLIEVAGRQAEPHRALLGEAETHLGRAYLHLGQLADAEAALRSAVARQHDMPVYEGNARVYLGQTLIDAERFDPAEQELARARELYQPWVVDDSSLLWLTVEQFYGRLRLRQGRAREAVDIFERVIGRLSALDWFQEADYTYEVRSWLAEAYRAVGRHDAAESAMRRSLSSSQALLGPRHPTSQVIRIGLAEILLEKDGPAAAAPILAAVDRDALARLGAEHPYLGELRRVEGLIAVAERRTDAARLALRESQRIFAARYGKEHGLAKRAAAELAKVAG